MDKMKGIVAATTVDLSGRIKQFFRPHAPAAAYRRLFVAVAYGCLLLPMLSNHEAHRSYKRRLAI